jgi:hypothetical protein
MVLHLNLNFGFSFVGVVLLSCTFPLSILRIFPDVYVHVDLLLLLLSNNEKNSKSAHNFFRNPKYEAAAIFIERQTQNYEE